MRVLLTGIVIQANKFFQLLLQIRSGTLDDTDKYITIINRLAASKNSLKIVHNFSCMKIKFVETVNTYLYHNGVVICVKKKIIFK